MLHTVAAFDRIGEENAFAVLARATALAAQGKDVINLGIDQPDFRTPDHIVEAADRLERRALPPFPSHRGSPLRPVSDWPIGRFHRPCLADAQVAAGLEVSRNRPQRRDDLILPFQAWERKVWSKEISVDR